MNQQVVSLLLMNMLMNLIIIGGCVYLARDGVCIEPIYMSPIITNE